MATPQQDMRAEFRPNSREHYDKVGTIAFAENTQATPLRFPKVGYLSYIHLSLRGVQTLSGAGALKDKGPWNLLNRIQLTINIGSAEPINLTGYGAAMLSSLSERGYRPDRAGAGDTTPHIDNYSAPVASGANVWNLNWLIPVALNRGLNSHLGLLPLQAQELECHLQVTFGAALDAATLATGFVGTLHVYYGHFEIPDFSFVKPPPLYLVRRIEDTTPINAVGDVIYTVPRMGQLFQLMHIVTLNGSRSDSIDEGRIIFQKGTRIWQIDRWAWRCRNRIQTGIDFPTGVYLHDFFHSTHDLSDGDTRDVIDTTSLSTLESVVAVSSGATLGANNNYLNNVRMIMQPLVVNQLTY